MSFVVKCNASGDVLEAYGNIRQERGHVYGLSGVGTDGLDGLVNAYSEKQAAFSGAWIGQYSAVVVEKNTVTLAQSSLGLGRAYYAQLKDKLVVGSDLSAVARIAECTDLDPVFFSRFLAMRPVLDRTPYSLVRQLFGGETIVFKGSCKRRLRPWHPTDQKPQGVPLDRLHSLLQEAIDTYAPVDDATMIDISGGTDSSLVAAIAAKMGRKLHAISHIPERGARGSDHHYARLVASRLNISLTEIDSDIEGMTTELPDLPHQPGGCSYRDTTLRIAELFRKRKASRHLTGVGGDVIFDFRGLAPAFLADPLVAGRPMVAWRKAAAYALERGGHRGAAHYLRYVALPIAVSYFRGRNIAGPPPIKFSNWLDASFAREAGDWRGPLAGAISRPSSRFLWELIFDVTAGENLSQQFSPTTETVHPLLHRPLVEYCLSLAPETRRGIGSDRALQRDLLAQLGLEEISERSDKGSAQPLREMHLTENPAFLDSLVGGQLASLGWVNPPAWRRAIDQIKVGVSPYSVGFVAAVECELWLRRAIIDGRIKSSGEVALSAL